MNNIDKQLEHVQEDQVTEIAPIMAGAAALATVGIVAHLIIFLMAASDLKRSTKIDPVLSKRLNKILKSGNKWIVHVFKLPSPNAFSLGFGKHIFVTSSLLKLLDKDETDAILLHEAYHSQSKHTLKKMAYHYPLFYLVTFVGVGITLTTGAIALAFIAAFMLKEVGEIAYDVTMGRRHELKADDYAIRYGYGKQLISSLKKLEKWAAKKSKNQKCGRWCKIINSINDSIDEHPSNQKRIEIILRKTKELGKLMKIRSFGKMKKFVMGIWKNNV